jgi:hypothetical protein
MSEKYKRQIGVKTLLRILRGSWFRNWFRWRDRYWLTKEKALIVLKQTTGQDFGYDVKAWSSWFKDHPEFK